MGHIIAGYSVAHRGIFEKCLRESQRSLNLGRACLQAMQRGQAHSGAHYYKLFFGANSPARLKRVVEVVTLMDLALNSSSVQFEYNVSCGATTNAVAFTPDGGWSAQSIKDLLKSGRFRVSLCPRFFTALPQNDRMSQSRTGTLLHELSHIVANTNDIAQNHINGANIAAAPAGTTCYGRPLSRQLADGWPNLAIENAENYGFFLTDLLAEASLVSEDVSLEGLFN
jgi:Lysine-specific metallo-endopeptidase